MYIVQARLAKRSIHASSAGFSEALKTSIEPRNGIEHIHIADSGIKIEATFFVLQPTLAEAEAATLEVCTRAASRPKEDGNWAITHCMGTILPQAGDMLLGDDDEPGPPAP